MNNELERKLSSLKFIRYGRDPSYPQSGSDEQQARLF